MSKRIPIMLTAVMAAILVFTALSGCIQTSQTKYDLNLWDNGPLTLDPAISSEMSSHLYVMQIYSGLVKFDSQLKPVPDIADRCEISDDGKTYTFNLRENARFHDGSKVTAADIKYSLERACYPETSSQTASIYLSDISGVEDVLSGKSKDLSGVQAIDDNTLQISIDAPKAYFLSKLAYPTAFIVDRKNVESGSNWWHKPNGTGPYKLAKFNEDALIVLRPNEYYYGTKATASVAFHILAGIPMSLYETGKIDVVQVYKDHIDRAQDAAGPFAGQLHLFPEFSLQYIGFNTAKPPFNDLLVRQAFCHSVDKERIIELIQKNMATKADGIIPIGMPGYNKNVPGLDFDPALARELLSKSSYGSAEQLPPITLTAAGYGGVDVPDYMGAILQDWENNLGVKVIVRLLEPIAFHYYLKEEVDNMYALGWIADYPDPQNFLYTLFYTGTEYNDMHYSNPELDSLLDQAAIEQDYDTRISLYHQAEQIVINQAPLMPLWFGTNYVLISPDVHGYTIDPLGVPKLNFVTVDK